MSKVVKKKRKPIEEEAIDAMYDVMNVMFWGRPK